MRDLIYSEIAGSAEEYYKYEEKINQITLNDIKKIKLKN